MKMTTIQAEQGTDQSKVLALFTALQSLNILLKQVKSDNLSDINVLRCLQARKWSQYRRLVNAGAISQPISTRGSHFAEAA